MKNKKLKNYLSIVSLKIFIKDTPYFTIESKNIKSTQKDNTTKKSFIKILSKNIFISKYLETNFLKYPMIIKTFKNSTVLYSYLLENNKTLNSSIVFIRFDNIRLKKNDSFCLNSMVFLNSINELYSIFDSKFLFLKCLKFLALK